MNTFWEVVDLALDSMADWTHGLAHCSIMFYTYQGWEASKFDSCETKGKNQITEVMTPPQDHKKSSKGANNSYYKTWNYLEKGTDKYTSLEITDILWPDILALLPGVSGRVSVMSSSCFEKRTNGVRGVVDG